MSELKKQERRAQIALLYKENKTEEIILRTTRLIKLALEVGYDTGVITKNIIDLGVKSIELATALSIALDETDDSKLNSTDKKIKQQIKQIVSDIK